MAPVQIFIGRFVACFILSVFFFSGSLPAFSQIKWMSFSEAVKVNSGEKKKKVFVDVYTDWCGWCKQMDKTTFRDSTIVEYMNKHFIAVKLNAEMKDTVVFNNYTWTNPNPGGRATHSIAAAMLNDDLSYPTFVMLDEDFKRMDMQKGFKDANFMKTYLEFYIYEKYKVPSPGLQDRKGEK